MQSESIIFYRKQGLLKSTYSASILADLSYILNGKHSTGGISLLFTLPGFNKENSDLSFPQFFSIQALGEIKPKQGNVLRMIMNNLFLLSHPILLAFVFAN